MQGECVTVRRVSVVVKTLLHCQKRLLSFQKEQLFVFNDKQSTQYHKKKHSCLMKETRTRRLCEWRRRKKRVTGVLNRI